jgi:hypothetical protein
MMRIVTLANKSNQNRKTSKNKALLNILLTRKSSLDSTGGDNKDLVGLLGLGDKLIRQL